MKKAGRLIDLTETRHMQIDFSQVAHLTSTRGRRRRGGATFEIESGGGQLLVTNRWWLSLKPFSYKTPYLTRAPRPEW